MNIVVTVINRNYLYEAANESWFRAMGKERSQMLGRTVARVWGRKEFQTVMRPKLDSCFAGVEVRDERWVHFPVLGRRYCEVLYWPYPLGGPGLSRVAVIYNDMTERKTMEEHLTERKEAEGRLKACQGHRERLEGTVTDMAERKRAEEALRQAEEKYHNIFLNATEGIFQISPEGRFLSVNPAFARIHGYDSPEELTGHVANVTELHASLERRSEYLGLLYGQGYVHNFEFTVNRKDGSLTWVSVNAKVVRDERGTVLYHEGTVQDVTERKRAEEALEIKSRSLEEANTALKVLLKHREEDRRELEERFLLNVKQLVLPYVEKLKKGRLDTVQQTSVDFLEANLKEIVSPFLNNIRGFNFTPRQTEIIALIRDGKTTKEIAEFLHVGKGAVDIQRFLIRKRLGLNKDKANLRSYLLSLS
jgi:PAS domain S-box-containing protein